MVAPTPPPATDQRISAAEAASRLGVKRETIYAYVSRGFLSSERHIDGKSSTFDPAEIDRFRRRKADHRPGRLEVPVASGITEVVDGYVRYRGHGLSDLVHAGHSYESIAELLWSGELSDIEPWSPNATVAGAVRKAANALPSHATPTDRMMAGVVAAGAADPFRDDRSTEGAVTTARQLIRAIVDSLPTDSDVESDQIAERLWVRLTDADPAAWRLLQVAMTTVADHGMAFFRHKQWCYDSGLRVPLIIAGPEIDPAVRHDLALSLLVERHLQGELVLDG